MAAVRRLTFADRLALGWGKLRRVYLIAFHSGRVRCSLARRVGKCDRTGACCKLMFECSGFATPGGQPACTLYVDRGPSCSLFPIDERDLRDRDRILPGHPCGYRFVPEAEFARLPAERRPRFVFPWEVDGNALGGRVRRTNVFTLSAGFLRTVWAVSRRARERRRAARGIRPVTFLRSWPAPAPSGAASPPAPAPFDGVVFVRVRGASMAPRIPQESLVLVDARDAVRAAPGMIACFRSAEGLLVHHLVARLETPAGVRFVHQGERGAPGIVAAEDVIGRVAGIVPESGGPLQPVGAGRVWPEAAARTLAFATWMHWVGLPPAWVWPALRRARTLRALETLALAVLCGTRRSRRQTADDRRQ